MIIKNGGNVFVLCYFLGMIFDFFECLSSYFDSCGLIIVFLYFLSLVFDSLLVYFNIYVEW